MKIERPLIVIVKDKTAEQEALVLAVMFHNSILKQIEQLILVQHTLQIKNI